MDPHIPHNVKQAYPTLPPHIQLGIAQQQHAQQGQQAQQVGQGLHVLRPPRPPRRKYIRRTVRTIMFGFLAFAFTAAAIKSYAHAHRTGYAPLAQASNATGHYPNPFPFLLAGIFFALLASLQVRKIFRVRKLRGQHQERAEEEAATHRAM
jgi:hypothetical protein